MRDAAAAPKKKNLRTSRLTRCAKKTHPNRTKKGGAPLSHVDVTGARPIELARAKSERLKTEAENANKNNNDASNSIMIDTFAGMRNDLNKISRFLEAREKMEEAMANPPPSSTRSSNASNSSQTSSGYKLPTLSMKIGSKMPHPSYFIYVVMAPIGAVLLDFLFGRRKKITDEIFL